ncbi:hypothetical protein GQ600_11113 [Phytophthora cactorum]|nr:hypothetical protein GQ600_11113 [Phytophthora cactorum]
MAFETAVSLYVPICYVLVQSKSQAVTPNEWVGRTYQNTSLCSTRCPLPPVRWSRCPLSASPAALSAVVAVRWSRYPMSADPAALSAGVVVRWYCLLPVALSASPLSASVAVRWCRCRWRR